MDIQKNFLTFFKMESLFLDNRWRLLPNLLNYHYKDNSPNLRKGKSNRVYAIGIPVKNPRSGFYAFLAAWKRP